MAQQARWIRAGTAGPQDLRASCIGLARGQGEPCGRPAPIVLWARAAASVASDLIRVEAGHYAYALIVPLALAPGRALRWCAWGLAPALATYRRFGARAWLDGDALWLNGRRVAQACASTVGASLVLAASFLPRLPRPAATWDEDVLESAFRERLEAQHGWQFDNCWPTALERAIIAAAGGPELAPAG